jgi:hypothetical protein
MQTAQRRFREHWRPDHGNAASKSVSGWAFEFQKLPGGVADAPGRAAAACVHQLSKTTADWDSGIRSYYLRTFRRSQRKCRYGLQNVC